MGHSLCTGLAVIGGRFIAQRISVRTGNLLWVYICMYTWVLGFLVILYSLSYYSLYINMWVKYGFSLDINITKQIILITLFGTKNKYTSFSWLLTETYCLEYKKKMHKKFVGFFSVIDLETQFLVEKCLYQELKNIKFLFECTPNIYQFSPAMW